MKKYLCFLLCALMVVSLAACGSTPQIGTSEEVDVDLTLLSSTMVYSEVYNMMVSPEDYIGKRVKMTGRFRAFQDKATEKVYLTCIIADAAACCSRGLDFVLKDEHAFPDDYPALYEPIIVTGVFNIREEDGYSYIQLIDAEIE